MFYNNLNIEQCVDELKSVREQMKLLKQKEDELKDRMLKDGRNEIKGANHVMKKTIRTKEVFNKTAFIEAFSNDDQFDKELKDSIIVLEPTLNEENLNDAIKENKISIDYVIPFNTLTETVVINIK